MVWVRLDDRFPDHPKVVDLSDRAFRIHIRGLCYSAEHLTDGVIPRSIALSWGTLKHLQQLVDRGIWETHGRGYSIHDYTEYQWTRAQAESKRIAGARGAALRWGTGSAIGSSIARGEDMEGSGTKTEVSAITKRLLEGEGLA